MGVLKVDNRKFILGKVKAGESRQIFIPIRNTGDKTLAVTRVADKKRKTRYYDGETQGSFHVEPGKTRTLAIKINLPEKKGRFMASIMVHSNARNVTAKGYKLIVKAKIN